MNAKSKLYSATKPERVFDKVEECRTLFDAMIEQEQMRDTTKFLNSLGGFLISFRSIGYRLYGVVEKQSGKQVKEELKTRLRDHPDIGFLIDRADMEVHGDGVTVYQWPLAAMIADPGRFASRFSHRNDRLRPRFDPFVQYAEVRTNVRSWRFEGRGGDLFTLCHDGLSEMESIVRQLLPATGS